MDVVERLILALRLAKGDNVATLLGPARAGAAIGVRDAESGVVDASGLRAAADIPFGHKVALGPIGAGQPVLKYGLPIGRATADIAVGEHVHVHNVASGVRPAGGERWSRIESRPRLVRAEVLRATVAACLRSCGASKVAAADMADALTEAHLRGVETHGVRRLAPYVARIQAGGVDAAAEPVIAARGALLQVDGRNGIGHHVAATAADAAAATAAEHGVGLALVRNSNHFGFAGHFATRIAARGMVGVVTSNGQVLVGPQGGKRALFSNDPVAVAAPLPDGTFFEFDMAMSVASRARIVQALERGEAIPEGVAQDADGRPTTDAARAADGILLPFGGDRGFGLLAAVELLAGVLTGGAYADLVTSKEANPAAPEGTAHFLLAIDLEAAGGRERFGRRLADMVARMAGLPMHDGLRPPRHPGARRWRLRAERLASGVPLTDAEYDGLQALAARLGVKSLG